MRMSCASVRRGTADISQLSPLMVVTIEFYGCVRYTAALKAYNGKTTKPGRALVRRSYCENVIFVRECKEHACVHTFLAEMMC